MSKECVVTLSGRKHWVLYVIRELKLDQKEMFINMQLNKLLYGWSIWQLTEEYNTMSIVL